MSTIDPTSPRRSSVWRSRRFTARRLQGRCNDRPELTTTLIPLSARMHVIPVRGGERFLRGVFEPLGYDVIAERHPLDERFPEWGESPYFSTTISKETTLSNF